MSDKLIPLSEYAKKRGITQKAAYMRYRAGSIPAKKIGRDIFYLEKRLTSKDKKLINKAVNRTIKEYGEVLKRLDNE